MKLIDNASGNISQGITLDSTNKADRYKLSYNCSNIGNGKSYIRIYATITDGYKTYFMPIQFTGIVEFELNFDEATFLQFDVIGNATVSAINLETIVNATMEYVKENATYWDRIKKITSDTGKVRTDMFEGLINMTINAFSNASGTITQKDGVLTFLNGTTIANSTQAVQITGGAIRIANSKLANGEWNWTTAITGAGVNAATIIAETFAGLNITAVNIVSGTITGGTINGVTINGSKFVSTSGSRKMILDGGRIDFIDGSKLGVLSSDELSLFGTNGAVSLEAYNSFSIGTGSMLRSNNTLIVGNSAYSNNIQLRNDGYIDINPNFRSARCTGDFEVWGDKNSVIPTQHYGVRALYAEESDRSYFSTKGINSTLGGVCSIELDPVFMETIELNSAYPYLIQLTAYSNANIWVDEVQDNKFIVKSDKDTKFAYELKAIRISYLGVYLANKENYNNKDLAKIQEAAVRRLALQEQEGQYGI